MDVVLELEPTTRRRVFPRWSISIPDSFQETFVREHNYWHAWDEHRSVSLTSILLSDPKARRVSAAEILRQLPPGRGSPVTPPPGLQGWATVIKTPRGSRAGRAVSGIVAVEGAVLAATVTSDDVEWATSIWHSIVRLGGV